MPRELFYASARMFGETCLELYISRYTPQGKEQVYLIPRPANDPFYPSMLHMPGVRKIPTELDADHVQRALKEIPFKITRLILSISRQLPSRQSAVQSMQIFGVLLFHIIRSRAISTTWIICRIM